MVTMTSIDAYKSLLLSLLPSGKLFADIGPKFVTLVNVAAKEFFRVSGRIGDVESEINPSSADETIDQWEAEFGLISAGSDAERRARIGRKARRRIGSRRQDWRERMSDVMGYADTAEDTVIVEARYAPADLGIYRDGNALVSQEANDLARDASHAHNRIRVVTVGVARCGRSCDAMLANELEPGALCHGILTHYDATSAVGTSWPNRDGGSFTMTSAQPAVLAPFSSGGYEQAVSDFTDEFLTVAGVVSTSQGQTWIVVGTFTGSAISFDTCPFSGRAAAPYPCGLVRKRLTSSTSRIEFRPNSTDVLVAETLMPSEWYDKPFSAGVSYRSGGTIAVIHCAGTTRVYTWSNAFTLDAPNGFAIGSPFAGRSWDGQVMAAAMWGRALEYDDLLHATRAMAIKFDGIQLGGRLGTHDGFALSNDDGAVVAVGLTS